MGWKPLGLEPNSHRAQLSVSDPGDSGGGGGESAGEDDDGGGGGEAHVPM